MKSWRPLRFAMLICAAAGSAAAAEPVVQVDEMLEGMSHLIGPPPVIRTPWRDLTTQSGGGILIFRLTVGVDGQVTKAVPRFGPKAHRERALQMVKALKFKPFERDGRAVPATFDHAVQTEVADYTGPASRSFPASPPDPRQVRIALQRTGCFGTCPDYWVELRGDGQVTYRGNSAVLVEGEHRWRVAPAAVAGLLERFRQADYFRLDGYYTVDATDLPTYVTRLSIGRQQKFVLDYGAGGVGEAVASTSFGGKDPRIPPVVTELENAIDAAAGTARWVRGDAGTLAALRKANWNFRSPAAGRGLGLLVRDCRLALATGFIRAGTPVNVQNKGAYDEALPVANAARCGDTGLVRLLVAKGALARSKDAGAFFEAAVESGYPEFVEIALKHVPKRQLMAADGRPILFVAAEMRDPRDDIAADATYDPGRVTAMLLAAGADPNARNREGNTPLHETRSGAVARALIRGGADLNALGEYGQTPLFSKYFAEPKQVLIGAGADLAARDKEGRTALFYQHYADVAKVLIQAGLDVRVEDKAGATPLETASEEEIALMLLAAGAAVPTDPARLAALTGKATEKKWTALLQLLSAAAASPTP